MVRVITATGSVTTSSGSATASIYLKKSMLEQIIVNPATSTTTYDISLTDLDGFIIYDMDDLTGDSIEDDPGVPTDSILTLTISNASADEVFTYKLKGVESYD